MLLCRHVVFLKKNNRLDHTNMFRLIFIFDYFVIDCEMLLGRKQNYSHKRMGDAIRAWHQLHRIIDISDLMKGVAPLALLKLGWQRTWTIPWNDELGDFVLKSSFDRLMDKLGRAVFLKEKKKESSEFSSVVDDQFSRRRAFRFSMWHSSCFISFRLRPHSRGSCQNSLEKLHFRSVRSSFNPRTPSARLYFRATSPRPVQLDGGPFYYFVVTLF